MAPRTKPSRELGIGARNSQGVLEPAQSWHAWTQILNSDAESLQNWIRSQLLPQIVFFLALKEHKGKRDRPPPNDQILDVVRNNAVICATDDRKFLDSREFSELTVWGRAVYRVEVELDRKFKLDAKYFPNAADKIAAAHAFLVFLNKEMGKKRVFDTEKQRNSPWVSLVNEFLGGQYWHLSPRTSS